MALRYLYYYRSRIFILLSSHFRLHNWTKISPGAPNSTVITAYICLCLQLTNSLPLDRSLVAFILCFYDQTSSKKTTSSSSVAVSVAGVGDHDFPLFAISCIHKHLRSASSQPGCYTVLYFYSLTTSTSFSFDPKNDYAVKIQLIKPPFQTRNCKN